jgi:hypothetical protein
MEPHYFGSNSAFPINLSTTSLSMNFFIPDNFQKISCKQYKERCHEKIFSLTKSLQQYKSFYKQSQFIRKFIKYIPTPSVLEVPEIKYFSRILKHFRKHVITVYQLLSDEFDDSFNGLPSAQYLINFLLLKIVSSSNISNEVSTLIISIIEESDLSYFDEYIDVSIFAMLQYHKEIIRSSLSNGIILNNQPDSSDENQLHFEDQPSNDTQSPFKSYFPLSSTSSQYSSISSIIVSNSIVGPEEYSPPETAEEVIPIIPSLCCSTTVGSIVEEWNIVEYYLTTSTIVYPKILNLTLLFKKEKVFLFISIYRTITFFGRKLRMLEQLSHCPMIVASDVVSVG